MDYRSIAKTILALAEADLSLRDRLLQNGQLNNGYNPKMEQLHNKNTRILNDIMDTVGYPTADKVGEEASKAAWLVIQHAISQPDFMRKCAELLAKAVTTGIAAPQHLAYLTDRIAVLEGKPQRYGTQFDWDESGNLCPKSYDDLAEVNNRRKAIGLNTIEEQTKRMNEQARKEQQSPPKDADERKQQYAAWRKAVGWVK